MEDCAWNEKEIGKKKFFLKIVIGKWGKNRPPGAKGVPGGLGVIKMDPLQVELGILTCFMLSGVVKNPLGSSFFKKKFFFSEIFGSGLLPSI